MSSRRGQAMVETVLAVLFVTVLFYGLFALSRRVTARILVDHAAARAARAKAVGFDDFMCLKSARVALIPVAGKRLWPATDAGDEVARVPDYLASANEARARGLLEYERWNALGFNVRSDYGLGATATCDVDLDYDGSDIAGSAAIESHFPLYMYNQGY